MLKPVSEVEVCGGSPETVVDLQLVQLPEQYSTV